MLIRAWGVRDEKTGYVGLLLNHSETTTALEMYYFCWANAYVEPTVGQWK